MTFEETQDQKETDKMDHWKNQPQKQYIKSSFIIMDGFLETVILSIMTHNETNFTIWYELDMNRSSISTASSDYKNITKILNKDSKAF